MSERMPQVDELVKQSIAKYVQRDFPDRLITITQVHVTKDLGYAKVWVDSLGDPISAAKLCQGKAAEYRKMLSKQLVIKKIPMLNFVPDITGEKVDRIEELLHEINKEKNVD